MNCRFYLILIPKNLITLDEIVKDDKININFFEKISKHWSSSSALVDCLRTANSHQYIDATSNYRNKSQHRHPQHLDVGQTLNFVVGMGIKLPSSDPDPFSEEMMKQNIASLGEDDEIDVDYEIDTDIDKCVIYSFETSKPLSTETILPSLEDESKHLRAAFMAYRSLVDEQTNS
jgi:hypothetical protein